MIQELSGVIATDGEVAPDTPDQAVLSCSIIQKRFIFRHIQRVFLQRNAASAAGVKF